MFLVYWVAMVGVGAPATDFTNDCVFGDGFHLFGKDGGYGEIAEEYAGAAAIVDGYDAYVEENGAAPTDEFTYEVEDEETLEISEETASIDDYNEAKNITSFLSSIIILLLLLLLVIFISTFSLFLRLVVKL